MDPYENFIYGEDKQLKNSDPQAALGDEEAQARWAGMEARATELAGLLKGGGYFREAWHKGVTEVFAPALKSIETARNMLPAVAYTHPLFGPT